MPSSLANQTWAIIVWLDFSFQKQIHHNLCQIAACSSFSQGWGVVKGSHVILQRKTVSKSFDFFVWEELTGKISVSLGGKINSQNDFLVENRSFLSFSFIFLRLYSQPIKQRQTFLVFSSLMIIFIYLGNLFTDEHKILNREPGSDSIR